MLELRQLRYFAAVAEFKSLTRAAKALHMTQPSLSRQLSQLERELGHQLLTRNARGANLTAGGRCLLAHLPKIMYQVERIPDVLAAAEREAHLICLGVPPGVPYDWFDRFAEILRNRQPYIVLSLFEGTSDQLVQMIDDDVVDVALVHTEPDRLSSHLVLSQRMGCVFLDPARASGSTAELSMRQLGGLRVMAQSVPSEQITLRAWNEGGGHRVQWLFRNYSHHGKLVARASAADAVLVTEATANKDFHGLTWVPFAANEPVSLLRMWACWRPPGPAHLNACLDAVFAAARGVPSTNGRSSSR